ncbi:gypsy-type retrotransposon rire2 protein [Hordeum vulgare]|nr:gypsy-type retrotransposon rire2 protein [Hordeum vulgare]
MLPPASLVAMRIRGAETAPTPQEGEVVVFDEYFYRGFGLPASNFFANFLTFFGLQLHHLAPNAILQLASFVVLCEGFLGIEPRLDLWQSLFFFKKQSIKMDKVELFENLQGLNPPAADVETSDPSEIEDEGMIESRDAVSEEEVETEGSELSRENLRPPLVDWMDNDETPPSSYDAAFGEDAEEVEEVTSPPLTRGRHHAGETAVRGEAARNKGKGARTSKPPPNASRQDLQLED